jgi:hypothetical protein
LSAVDILSDKSISICNINIKSIRNKINFLQHFVDEFDIIVLTEIHLDNSMENRDIELDSFDKNPQRKDRTNSGGGLLIYSKEDIGICRKRELENDIDETIWVEVHAKGHSFLLCNTYRPEWTDSEYWARLNHAIGLAYQVNENIVISGDLCIWIWIYQTKYLPHSMVYSICKQTQVQDWIQYCQPVIKNVKQKG